MASTRGRRKGNRNEGGDIGRNAPPAARTGRGRRPSGGASPLVRRPREWPAMVVLGCLAIALLVSVPAGFRVSTVLIAATFAVAVVLRLTVRDAGVLAIRSRAVDVGMFLVFGVVVLLLGLSVPDPVIDLPWVPHRTG